MDKRIDWQVYAAAAIVVCYLIVRHFYLDYVNFAAWAFLLSAAAAVFVPQPIGVKHKFAGRERLLTLLVMPVLFAVMYDGMLLPPSRFDSVDAVVATYMKLTISALAFFIGWLAVRGIMRPAEDLPAAKYALCAIFTALGIGGFFAFEHAEHGLILMFAVMFSVMAVMSLQRSSLVEFIKSRKGERK